MPRASYFGLIRMGVVICALGVLGAAWFQYGVYDRPIVLPNPRGPHSVGRMLFDWTNPERSRELMVFVWYPSSDSNGPVAEYVPGKWGELAAEGSFPIPSRRIRQIRVASREGGGIVAGEHPLLVLSPGMGRLPTDYTVLAEDLASFGYIVAGVTPTGSARVVVFSDGSVVRGRDEGDVDEWVADFHFTVDQVLAEPRLSAHVDQHRIGIVGHSFGGAAAMHALQRDERFARGVNLDGAPQWTEINYLTRALMIVDGAPLPASQKKLNDQIVAEFHHICSVDIADCHIEEVPEAGHMNFSDAGVLPSRFPIPRSHFNLTEIDGVAFLHRVSDLLRGFFDRM